MGPRSASSHFEMTWTVLDLKRFPPTTRCCQHCNPELVDAYSASTVHDERIKKFAPEFLFPIVPSHSESRPSSSLSIRSAISTSSTFVPVSLGYKVPLDEKERLRSRLIQWREKMHVLRGSPLFFSSQIFLPPKQLNLLVSECNKYLQAPIVDARFLRKLIQWDSAGEAEWDEVSQLIMEWREDARPPATPTSQRRPHKKSRARLEAPRSPMVQPNFQVLNVAPPSPYMPAQQRFPASDVFQTPQPTNGQSNRVPQTLSTSPHPRQSNVYQPPFTHPNALPTVPTEPIPSPLSNIQTNPYYQLISNRPAVYPQSPIFPYNLSPPGTVIYQTPTAPRAPSSLQFSYQRQPPAPGTIIYQTPTAPPSSLRFSYYNHQTPQ